MNLGELRARVRNNLPQATSVTILDSSINAEINRGVDQVNLTAECYRTDYPCNTVAGIGSYSLSTICPGYLNIWKSGIWFFDSDGKSRRIWPKTKRWLDNMLINWRDASPVAVPTWVAIELDTLIFQPAPSGINKFTVDAVQIASPMTNDGNYPWWNKSTELTELRCMDEAIAAFATWKFAPAVFDNEGRNYYEQQFKARTQEGLARVRRRWDMTSDYDYYIRPDIQSGFLPRY